MLGEETVKVVARLAIDSVPQDVRNFESILDRVATSVEKAVNSLERLERPFHFCFYCIGVSMLLVGASRVIESFRVGSRIRGHTDNSK
jgi:hypothetical protein